MIPMLLCSYIKTIINVDITKYKKKIRLMLNAWENYIRTLIIKNESWNDILIHVFTLERILNEMNYELRYRPENVLIPILGLQEFTSQKFTI